MVAYMHYIAN